MIQENKTAPTSVCHCKMTSTSLPGLAAEGASPISSLDKTRARARKHYYLYREEILKKRRADYAANPQKYLLVHKIQYIKHREKRIAAAHLYRQKHLIERRAADKAYYLTHKQKARDYQRTHKYGLNPIDIENLINAQGGGCAICNKNNLIGRNQNIDHDHATMKIRGILCRPCNSVIGLIGEDIIILLYMIKYLIKFKGIPKIKDRRQAEMMKRMAEIFMSATGAEPGKDSAFLRRGK